MILHKNHISFQVLTNFNGLFLRKIALFIKRLTYLSFSMLLFPFITRHERWREREAEKKQEQTAERKWL